MMSGGVDSSVTAALLSKKRNFAVSGIFMKNWEGGEQCQWAQDEQDARRVAAKIGISFYVLNFEKEYRALVFEPFLQGITQGMTPNPDVFCNQEIKFGVFLARALALGADMVATGHYARVKKTKNGVYKLCKSKDKHKDQTYFLYRLNQFQLSKILFPLGNYTKTEVRARAKEFSLPTFDKPDSQGICFVGEMPFDTFLAQYIPLRQGEILDKKGNKLGVHQGAAFYTIGQRKGLGIGGVQEPLYLAKKDMETNTLTVTKEYDPLLYTKSAGVTNLHWVSGSAPKDKQSTIQVRFRHQQPFQRAKISLSKEVAHILFSRSQRAITPGQSAVFYKGNEILGGGIIS